MPARAPPQWETSVAGAEPGDLDPQLQPAPDYEFDQRITW